MPTLPAPRAGVFHFRLLRDITQDDGLQAELATVIKLPTEMST